MPAWRRSSQVVWLTSIGWVRRVTLSVTIPVAGIIDTLFCQLQGRGYYARFTYSFGRRRSDSAARPKEEKTTAHWATRKLRHRAAIRQCFGPSRPTDVRGRLLVHPRPAKP